MSQCVRTNTVSVWCYECHQFYPVVVCEVMERQHRGHRTRDYERGAVAHTEPCLCIKGFRCKHDNDASNHA